MTHDQFLYQFSRRHVFKTILAMLGATAIAPVRGRLQPLAALAASEDWSASPDIAKAKEQAKDFVTYGMPDDWANYGEVLQKFATKYGFTLHHVDTDMSSNEEITKYDAEKANPKAIASDIGILYGPVAEKKDVVPPYMSPNAERLPVGFKGTKGGWVATFTGVPAFVVNTDIIKDVPKTWDDLLKPEFKGKISALDARKGGTDAATFIAWAFAYGGDASNLKPAIPFAQKMVRQFASAPANAPTLEKGEVPIWIRYDFNCVAAAAQVNAKGVHTQVVIPGISIYAPLALMINRYNTAKMDVAKLWLDFVLTDEAQESFAKFGARPIRYVLGDLQLPATAKSNWLPTSAYTQVKQINDWPKIDVAQIADIWDSEVLGG